MYFKKIWITSNRCSGMIGNNGFGRYGGYGTTKMLAIHINLSLFMIYKNSPSSKYNKYDINIIILLYSI